MKTEKRGFRQKAARQFDLLARAIAQENNSTLDFEVLYNISKATVNRDLQDLRDLGVDIHIDGGYFVLSTPLTRQLQYSTLMYFIGGIYSENEFDKATALIIEKNAEKAIPLFSNLQFCIDNKVEAELTYCTNDDSTYQKRRIQPLFIFHSDRAWRVLVQENNSVKQFILEKISSVNITSDRFEPKHEDVYNKFFRYSWRSWVGCDEFEVELELSPKWTSRIKERSLLPGQKLSIRDDGSSIFSVKVNTLSEIAGWIVSRGRGVRVLKPLELAEKVKKLALEALENYKI